MYLSYTLRTATDASVVSSTAGPNVVVGVVGIGHVEGIKNRWEKVKESDVRKILVIPKPSFTEKAIGLVFKATFYGAICYGGYKLLKNPTSRFIESLSK